MKKKFYIIVFLSVFIFVQPAYAIIDIMATVQSALEVKKEIETKIQTIRKKISDIEKRVVQGYKAGANCFSNPKNCGVDALTKLVTDMKSKDPLGVRITEITGVRTIEGAEELSEGDVVNKKSESLEKDVLEAYTYVKGVGNDLERLSIIRKEVNAVVADEAAILFAKGATVRQSIRNENAEEIYPTKIENQLSDIIAVHNALAIKSQERLTRILELKSYMNGAQSNAELAQHTLSEDELDELLEN
ncbi:MAG: hypothetical protein IKW39_01485 [Alphaproteobacteria bacterium]|nr:hypothetical protein [Alphaproteobacteria bacterium]